METWLEKFSVGWQRGHLRSVVDGLKALVEANSSEADLQAYLARHPIILALMEPHCHHVIPKERLGSQYEMDFLLPEMSSGGTQWIAVEIESPAKKMNTKKGRKSADLEHALQQIRDWRDWIRSNIDYARRPRELGGLGLEDIDDRIFGLLILGRRKDQDSASKRIKQQVFADEHISIRSWDGVVEWASGRADFWDNYDNNGAFATCPQDLT